MSSAFVVGFGLGALVAAQLGPISLLLIRTVMRGAVLSGLAIGCAVAIVDTLYAMLGVAGAAPLLQIDPLRLALGLVGAAVLVALGARTIWSAFRIRLGGEAPGEVTTPRRAFRTGLAATASNPLTIASWAAVFAAATTAGATSTTSGTIALLVGVGLGSLAWHVVLTGIVGVARARVTDRGLEVVDLVAGSGLIVFGGLLGLHTVRDE